MLRVEGVVTVIDGVTVIYVGGVGLVEIVRPLPACDGFRLQEVLRREPYAGITSAMALEMRLH